MDINNKIKIEAVNPGPETKMYISKCLGVSICVMLGLRLQSFTTQYFRMVNSGSSLSSGQAPSASHELVNNVYNC